MRASRLSRPALALLLAGTVLSAAPVLAQSVSPGATIDLGTVWLDADNPVKLRFGVTPGGVTLIDRSEARDTEVAPRLTDALRLNPGIVLQEFFGGNDQPRIQIRGSGQQQNPAERGLLVMIDGMPVNRADGAYVVGIASPGGAETIEVFRGAAANRLGAAVLGGALNFTSPSGASQPGWRGAVGAGSFERRDIALSYGFDGERADSWFHLEHSESDGFRDYNSSDRTVLGGNVTFAMGEATTRLFFTHTDLSFDVAGPLTWAALQADPTQNHTGPVMVGGVPTNPGPNVLRDKPHRETVQTLAGLRTTWEGAGGLFDIGLSVGRTDDSFAFPISAGFRDTDGTDGTLTARYTIPGAGDLPLFEAGLSWSLGEADRDYFHNIGGNRGAAFGKNKLKAETLSIHAGANVEIGAFTLSPSLAFIHATRKSTDLWTGATRPTVAFSPMNPAMALPNGAVAAVSTSYDRDYSGFAPSLALSWAPAEGQFAWVSLAKSYEPPTHDDLIGTVGGTPNSGPGRPAPGAPDPAAAMFATPDLKAQTSVTLEAGWRGEAGALSWDVTAYHSRLKNELLSLRDGSGAALASVNADRTVHSGLELGLGAALSDTLATRVAWTWQDFRFDNGPLRGNKLAGAPEHVLTLALDWQATERLALSGTLHWVPGKTPVDNMNTVFNDSYALVDLGASWSIGEKAVIVAEVTNLFDEHYASSTLVIEKSENPQSAFFIPGEGRAFYLGARLAF